MTGGESTDFHTGEWGAYRWLTCANDTYMGTVVNRCPEILLGRYVAITSIDSGVPRLTEQQQQVGWECRGGVAYSQAIQTIDELFYQRDGPDSPGYDEWWIFETPIDLGEVSLNHPFLGTSTRKPDQPIVFVNYPFRIDDGHPLYEPLRELFWAQIEKLRPESYIADGRDCLTFVTRNRDWFELASRRLQGEH